VYLPKISRWEGFEPDTNRWIGSDLDARKDIIARNPHLLDATIYSEVPSLQSFIYNNLLMIANQVLDDGTEYVYINVPTVPEAKADYKLNVNQETVAPMVIKGCWVLEVSDIVGEFSLGGHHAVSAVNQVYSYMLFYKAKYGILSSYQHTWFLRREIKDGIDVLEISNGIACAQSQPTVVEALCFFAHTVATETATATLLQKNHRFQRQPQKRRLFHRLVA
jgi:hypothetical protein